MPMKRRRLQNDVMSVYVCISSIVFIFERQRKQATLKNILAKIRKKSVKQHFQKKNTDIVHNISILPKLYNLTAT